MDIEFRCAECDRVFRAQEQYAGRRVKCRGCGCVLVVPAAKKTSKPSWTSTRRAAPLPKPGSEALEEPPIVFTAQGMIEEEMDLTPMVDVTFLLLIFFMVTAAFDLQKSIEVPAPDQSEASTAAPTLEELEDQFVIVRVERDETTATRDAIYVDDEEVLSEQELLRKLRESREGSADTGRGPSSMLVMASGDARHASVVMVLDAGTSVGMEDVRLAATGLDDP